MLKYITLLAAVLLAMRASAAEVDSATLRRHVSVLCDTTQGYRTGSDTARLNKAAQYIHGELKKYRDSVTVMTYRADGSNYYNLIASYGPADAPRIIIGAHYDVCGEERQQGADDNASGIAGLLELARLLAQEDAAHWKYRVDLVAYTLEEPPYFRTAAMGSAMHAQYLEAGKIPVRGMVSLEMIGYFKDGKHTQHYPIGLLKLFYGSRGNYITVVHKVHKGSFVRGFQRDFKGAHLIRTKKFGAPRILPGIDFSDHLNYWNHGWAALMITDTSFFRNANYHRKGDTPETLDYNRMAMVVEQVKRAVDRMVQ